MKKAFIPLVVASISKIYIWPSLSHNFCQILQKSNLSCLLCLEVSGDQILSALLSQNSNKLTLTKKLDFVIFQNVHSYWIGSEVSLVSKKNTSSDQIIQLI